MKTPITVLYTGNQYGEYVSRKLETGIASVRVTVNAIHAIGYPNDIGEFITDLLKGQPAASADSFRILISNSELGTWKAMLADAPETVFQKVVPSESLKVSSNQVFFLITSKALPPVLDA